jgi:hypothetical protein
MTKHEGTAKLSGQAVTMAFVAVSSFVIRHSFVPTRSDHSLHE